MNDDGFTFLPGHPRLRKSDALICAIGSLDELNAALGLLRAQLAGHADATLVEAIQRDLFRIGSELATGKAQLAAAAIVALEAETTQRKAMLPPLHGFVLPGASEVSARAHWARAVCRRAERELVWAQEFHSKCITAPTLHYLNQLSGLLFALARAPQA
jgi:cob(I)alamin adenosyltransferase